MLIWGRYGWYGPDGSSGNDNWDRNGLGVHGFNYATNKWTYRNASLGPLPTGDGAAAYDPVNDVVWFIRSGQTWKYDVQADTWTQVTTIGNHNGAAELVLEYDSKRHALWAFGSEYPSLNDLWMYDIARNTWTNVNDSGDIPPATGGYGMAYDSINDVLLVVRDGTLYVFDPKTNVWTRPTTVGGPPPIPGRTHGKFAFDPVNNVAFLVGVSSGGVDETWAYRYRNAIVDNTPPTTVTGLAASGVSETRIDLSWNAASDPDSGISRYNIYRDGSFYRSVSSTSFADSGLATSSTHSYEVSAVNGGGVEGARSAAVSASTLADTTSPVLLGAVVGSGGEVVVSYSEAVTKGSAEALGNYALDGGASVTGA
ncbi:MAG TPA: hypothetical protein ENK48_05405, partial [Gammaproteobacteria bacterium]|nr:hypothetical protein [Gammaproteobacteria bacterium]